MLKYAAKFASVATVAVAISASANAQSVKSIAIPNSANGGIVANSVTDRIYAVSQSGSSSVEDTVSVIDGKSDLVVANISVPNGAYIPAVNILTNQVYVASCNTFMNPSPCFVTVIDGKTNTVKTTIPVESVENGLFAGITVDPVTNMIYVSDNTNQQIVEINGKNNTVTGSISLSGTPWGLTINPFNNKLYVSLGTDQIDIIDPKTKEIVTASTGAGTSANFNVAADWLTGRVLATSTLDASSPVSVLNAKGAMLGQATAGSAAYGIDVDPLTNLMFVANIGDNTTSIIHVGTRQVKATVAGTFSMFVTVNPASRKVYGIGSGAVTVFSE